MTSLSHLGKMHKYRKLREAKKNRAFRNRRSGYGIGISKAFAQWLKKKGICLPKGKLS